MSIAEFLQVNAGKTMEVRLLGVVLIVCIVKEPVKFTVSQENLNNFLSNLQASQVIAPGQSITQEEFNEFKNSEYLSLGICVY